MHEELQGDILQTETQEEDRRGKIERPQMRGLPIPNFLGLVFVPQEASLNFLSLESMKSPHALLENPPSLLLTNLA